MNELTYNMLMLQRIEAADTEIKEELQLIKKQFKDVITYKVSC
jgi:hypothetical protein